MTFFASIFPSDIDGQLEFMLRCERHMPQQAGLAGSGNFRNLTVDARGPVR